MTLRRHVCFQPRCPETVERGECYCWPHMDVCDDAGCERPEHYCDAPVHYCELHAPMSGDEREREIRASRGKLSDEELEEMVAEWRRRLDTLP